MALQKYVSVTHPYPQPVPETSDPVTVVASDATPMINEGVVAISGVNYDLTGMEGLVSYTMRENSRVVEGITYAPYWDQGFLIVVHPTTPNIYVLLSVICAMIQYGHEDRALSVPQRVAAMRHQRLRLQCGDAILVAAAILDDLGVAWRQVSLVTGETPTDFDDGHVAMEVHIGERWVFFDLAGDSYYIDSEGQALSLHDIITAGVMNCTQSRMAKSEFSAGVPEANTVVDPTHQTMYFNSRPYLDISISNDALYREWCRRVWQIPGILDTSDNLTYFYLPAALASRESYMLALSANYRVISEAAWLARFPQT